jgi:hypothetical protein
MIEILRGPLDIKFDARDGVADPASEVQFPRLSKDKGSKSNTLNPTGEFDE